MKQSDIQALGPVILNIEGKALSDDDKAVLSHPWVGGLIFFARNFESPEQITQLVADIRAVRPNLLITVDQEGGRVQRFQQGFTRIPAMQCFIQSSDGDIASVLPLVKDCGWLLASELLACDIDLSFAPVLDVDDNHCAVIANRSFSPSPQQVVQLAGAFIDGMHEAGMAATGKHFPGHGSVEEDSHVSLPVDHRSFEEILNKDWLPFAELRHKLDAIMPAHMVIPAVDQESVGFSSVWLQQKVRQDLGFKGIIFSDDLTMEGAAKFGSYGDRAELALKAGCDSVLVCNNRQGALEVLDRLEQGQFPVDNRLASLRKKQSVSWQSLESNPRWQKAKAQLEALADIDQ